MKTYYIALMEFELDNIDNTTGPKIVRAMSDLKEATGPAGESSLYQVNDPAGFERMKAELKRVVK